VMLYSWALAIAPQAMNIANHNKTRFRIFAPFVAHASVSLHVLTPRLMRIG
jgi:hypothetical protein